MLLSWFALNTQQATPISSDQPEIHCSNGVTAHRSCMPGSHHCGQGMVAAPWQLTTGKYHYLPLINSKVIPGIAFVTV
jgi:hypothetical protein